MFLVGCGGSGNAPVSAEMMKKAEEATRTESDSQKLPPSETEMTADASGTMNLTASEAGGSTEANPQGASLNLGPITPPPAWGQSSLFRFTLSDKGKPLARSRIEIYFRGANGKQMRKTISTDKSGAASFSQRMPPPSENKGHKWDYVDLYAVSVATGASGTWNLLK